MKINTKKTKVMKISRVEEEEKNMKIAIDQEEIHRILILVKLISDDAKCHKEIKKRKAMGKEAFTKRKELLKRGLNRDIKRDWLKH